MMPSNHVCVDLVRAVSREALMAGRGPIQEPACAGENITGKGNFLPNEAPPLLLDLNLTLKKIARYKSCGVCGGEGEAKNPVESAYASPARLYLDVKIVTDKRAMSF